MLTLSKMCESSSSNKMKLMSKKSKNEIVHHEKTFARAVCEKEIKLKTYKDFSRLYAKDCKITDNETYGNATIISGTKKIIMIINLLTGEWSTGYEISSQNKHIFDFKDSLTLKVSGPGVIRRGEFLRALLYRPTKIVFINCGCDDEILELLRESGFVGSLIISNNDLVTDKGLGYLIKCRKIFLASLTKITPAGIKVLTNCEDITMFGCPMAEETLDYLVGCRKVTLHPMMWENYARLTNCESLKFVSREAFWWIAPQVKTMLLFFSCTISINMSTSRLKIDANSLLELNGEDFLIETKTNKITKENYHSFVKEIKTWELAEEILNKFVNCEKVTFGGGKYGGELSEMNLNCVHFIDCTGLGNFNNTVEVLNLTRCDLDDIIDFLAKSKLKMLILDNCEITEKHMEKMLRFSGDIVIFPLADTGLSENVRRV